MMRRIRFMLLWGIGSLIVGHQFVLVQRVRELTEQTEEQKNVAQMVEATMNARMLTELLELKRRVAQFPTPIPEYPNKRWGRK